MFLDKAPFLLVFTMVFAQNNYSNQPNQYGSNSNQYGSSNNQPQYGNNNQPNQYGNNPPNQYGSNQPNQYGSSNNQYGSTTNQYGNNQQPYGSSGNNQYGNNNQPNQYGNNPSNQYGSSGNNPSYNNQPQFGGGQQNYGNQQYDNRQNFGNQPFNNQPLGTQPGDSNCCEDYCYFTDEEPYTHFATKTAYDSLSVRNNGQHVIPECTPVQFWSIIRQGTSYPTAERIAALRNLKKIHDQVVRNHEELRTYPDKGRLCNQDYDIVKRWFWNESISENRGESLSSQGMEELKLLARRYKAKYSQLLQSAYDERTYSFQYTNIGKTHDSYQAYIEGLFGTDNFRVHANVANDDMFNRPLENCNSWNRSQQQYFNTKGEYEKFIENREYQQMIRDVFRRLGYKFVPNNNLINDMYDMCRYEKAWYVTRHSPWCAAFTKSHLKLLEYAEDLKYFYKSGYGNPNSKRIGCGPLKDLYDKFDKTVSGLSDGNKGTFHFTHSSTFQAFLTALGVAEDYQPLRADNYYQQNRRKWQTSLIDPFAANFAAVLYECRGNERHKVVFFLNEEPVELQECDVGLCDWSIVQRKFETIVRSCNIDAYCNKAYVSHSSFISLLLSIVVLFRL